MNERCVLITLAVRRVSRKMIGLTLNYPEICGRVYTFTSMVASHVSLWNGVSNKTPESRYFSSALLQGFAVNKLTLLTYIFLQHVRLLSLCSLLSLSFNRKRKLNAWVDNPSLSRLRRLSPIKLYRRKCISRREVWRLSVLSSMGITNTCRILIELQEAVGYPCVYWTHNDIQQNFICMFTQKGMSFAAISRSATTFRNMKSVAID